MNVTMASTTFVSAVIALAVAVFIGMALVMQLHIVIGIRNRRLGILKLIRFHTVSLDIAISDHRLRVLNQSLRAPAYVHPQIQKSVFNPDPSAQTAQILHPDAIGSARYVMRASGASATPVLIRLDVARMLSCPSLSSVRMTLQSSHQHLHLKIYKAITSNYLPHPQPAYAEQTKFVKSRTCPSPLAPNATSAPIQSLHQPPVCTAPNVAQAIMTSMPPAIISSSTMGRSVPQMAPRAGDVVQMATG